MTQTLDLLSTKNALRHFAENIVPEVQGNDQIRLVRFKFAGHDLVVRVGDKKPLWYAHNRGYKHAREGFPHIGSEAKENDLGIEGTMVEVDKVRDSDKLVIFGDGVEVESVAGIEEAYVVVLAHEGVVEGSTMLSAAGKLSL
ncbi:hypothetical protein RJT34_15849 [Clitoria ternatea]|uniref:Uncharacterized protein n=1 Tax=Clitoria ternatea TaxID=43366 RepID=A0AAN9J963_CLITE